MKGSRNAASSGGSVALRTAITAATAKAEPGSSRLTPGTIQAAAATAAAETTQETSVRSTPRRGVAGCQLTGVP